MCSLPSAELQRSLAKTSNIQWSIINREREVSGLRVAMSKRIISVGWAIELPLLSYTDCIIVVGINKMSHALFGICLVISGTYLFAIGRQQMGSD